MDFSPTGLCSPSLEYDFLPPEMNGGSPEMNGVKRNDLVGPSLRSTCHLGKVTPAGGASETKGY